MSDKINTSQNDGPVKDYIASLADEQTVRDSQALIEMMQRISGHEPKMWNVGTIGFDTYHYKYDRRPAVRRRCGGDDLHRGRTTRDRGRLAERVGHAPPAASVDGGVAAAPGLAIVD